jgi:glycerophosphoryl diester phosphodiesterase
MNKKIITLAFCCFGLLSLKAQNITITAHRGASFYEPENTLTSIKKALEIGVDRIEIDIQRTKDSVLIVLHDKTIDRTTNGKGKSKDLNYKELQIYNIIDNDGKLTELTIPTLEEVLKLVEGKSTLLIEIKESEKYYPNIERQVVDLLNKYKALEWCIIQSFDDNILNTIHKLQPELALHKLCYGWGIKIKNLKKYEHIKEFSSMSSLTTKRFVKRVHGMGKKVNVWTVDAPIKFGKVIEKGVDGVITNRPILLKEFLNGR